MQIRALAIFAAFALPSLALAQPSPSTPPPPTANPSAPTTSDRPSDRSMDKSTDSKMDKSTDRTTPTDKTAKLSDGDIKIVAHLHHVHQMEIDAGKTAQKTGTARVKSYAEILIADHQSADKDLTAFAKQHKLTTIPADKPLSDADKQEQKDTQAKTAHMKALKGAAFDSEFLSMMETGHEKELAKVDTSIGSASDSDLQSMLKDVKPVLQRHADQARDLQKSPQASADQPTDKQP
jgi:putative membrane protein